MDGVRDPRMVESALARPANLARYRSPDPAELAAAYALESPRTSLPRRQQPHRLGHRARLLLADNGRRLEFDPIAAIRTV